MFLTVHRFIANIATLNAAILGSLVFPHPYHLVDLSPWPAMTSLSLLCLACGLVLYFHQYPAGGLLLCVALVTLAYAASLWWRDVIRESTLGFHTSRVKEGLHLGMILFIVSEAVFFVGVRRRAAIHAVGEITTCTVFA
ncbi:cytochrome c oxidase subunit III, N-terminal (mitochondrion) [Monoraphidium neglectum]|uniref:Cytochrome c oxidase subunit 3 n=1 Tax=Monoraphidium neglectum TaxID=145388 RepID=A0A0D2NV83_9CHLO|nr:cytochrome c oxidase subunit III, N-terminal [Monoraphidium neglectum]KIZ07966.1 cytochrome c oxidase subunit III, N-terminal [Monoraphidium neglectum]|eukprot:XP_013906985.1 cytochrome c oxidase subunit III, N-terminal (mitochondrion) [Monoraphidium neglectum]